MSEKCQQLSLFSDVNELDSYYVLSVMNVHGDKLYFGGLLFLDSIEQAMKFDSASEAMKFFKDSYVYDENNYAEFWNILVSSYRLDPKSVHVEEINTKSVNILSL